MYPLTTGAAQGWEALPSEQGLAAHARGRCRSPETFPVAASPNGRSSPYRVAEIDFGPPKFVGTSPLPASRATEDFACKVQDEVERAIAQLEQTVQACRSQPLTRLGGLPGSPLTNPPSPVALSSPLSAASPGALNGSLASTAPGVAVSPGLSAGEYRLPSPAPLSGRRQTSASGSSPLPTLPPPGSLPAERLREEPAGIPPPPAYHPRVARHPAPTGHRHQAFFDEGLPPTPGTGSGTPPLSRSGHAGDSRSIGSATPSVLGRDLDPDDEGALQAEVLTLRTELRRADARLQATLAEAQAVSTTWRKSEDGHTRWIEEMEEAIAKVRKDNRRLERSTQQAAILELRMTDAVRDAPEVTQQNLMRVQAECHRLEKENQRLESDTNSIRAELGCVRSVVTRDTRRIGTHPRPRNDRVQMPAFKCGAQGGHR